MRLCRSQEDYEPFGKDLVKFLKVDSSYCAVITGRITSVLPGTSQAGSYFPIHKIEKAEIITATTPLSHSDSVLRSDQFAFVK